MFEKLIEVLSALVAEFKRYNDFNVPVAPKAAAPAKETATKPAADKPAAKVAVEKPAAKTTTKAAPEGPTFAEVQKAAIDFVAAHGREKLVEVLEGAGVPADGEGRRKVSAAKDDPAMLAEIASGLAQATADADV